MEAPAPSSIRSPMSSQVPRRREATQLSETWITSAFAAFPAFATR